MGWDFRGYYYRAKKVNGRVEREYIGKKSGAIIAELDRLDRQKREDDRYFEKLEHDEVEALEESVAEVDTLVDLLARATLLASGYHQHKGGEWRKRRAKRIEEAG